MTQLLKYEIAASELQNPEDFEERLKLIFEETTDQPDQRIQALQELAVSSTLKTGESLADSALSSLTEPETDSAQDEKRRNAFAALESQLLQGKKKDEKGKRYQLQYDENGELTGMGIVKPLPEDKSATERERNASKKIPSGPKQNDTSFTTHIKRI